MGSVVDYFKPKDHYTFCDMLMAGDKHLWSLYRDRVGCKL